MASKHLEPFGVLLGKSITILRERKGLSQRALARNAGVSHGYVSLLESGQVPNPGHFKLTAVARALGYPDWHSILEAANGAKVIEVPPTIDGERWQDVDRDELHSWVASQFDNETSVPLIREYLLNDGTAIYLAYVGRTGTASPDRSLETPASNDPLSREYGRRGEVEAMEHILAHEARYLRLAEEAKTPEERARLVNEGSFVAHDVVTEEGDFGFSNAALARVARRLLRRRGEYTAYEDARFSGGVVPVYASGSVGDPQAKESQNRPQELHFEHIPWGRDSVIGPDAFIVVFRFETWNFNTIPWVRDGDLCWVSPDRQTRPGQLCAYRFWDDEGDEIGVWVDYFREEQLEPPARSLLLGPVVLVSRHESQDGWVQAFRQQRSIRVPLASAWQLGLPNFHRGHPPTPIPPEAGDLLKESDVASRSERLVSKLVKAFSEVPEEEQRYIVRMIEERRRLRERVEQGAEEPAPEATAKEKPASQG